MIAIDRSDLLGHCFLDVGRRYKCAVVGLEFFHATLLLQKDGGTGQGLGSATAEPSR